MKYVVVFHPASDNRTGKTYVKEKHTSEFATLTQARSHAAKFANASIYRVEWSNGNGWQYIRKLKQVRSA
ncbi:MAG: hypothetical protein J6S14_15730 [Clostridia bacterium]|nr:hypothetical protein [Clostridia bacterium]